MRMPLLSYAKIATYAIKNHKISEYVNLKLQKDENKKKNKRKAEYIENETTAENALAKIYPNHIIDDKTFVELENHIDSFINLKKELKYPSVENPYPIEFGLGKNVCRMLFYLVKCSQPDIIVETGVANGFSSSYMLLALDSLNKGKLISIDYLVMPWHTKEKVGQVIPETLRKWHVLMKPLYNFFKFPTKFFVCFFISNIVWPCSRLDISNTFFFRNLTIRFS